MNIPPLTDDNLLWIFTAMQSQPDDEFYFDRQTLDVFHSSIMGNYFNLKTGEQMYDFNYIDSSRHLRIPHILFVDYRGEYYTHSQGNELMTNLMRGFSDLLIKDRKEFGIDEEEILFNVYASKEMGEYFNENHSPWNKEEYDQYAAIRTATETTIAKRWLNSQ